MLSLPLQFSNGRAWRCGYYSENADGNLALGDCELDPIIPKSGGGEDDIVNRAPLGSPHNQLKRARDIDRQERRTEGAERRKFKAGVASRSLPDLKKAYA